MRTVKHECPIYQTQTLKDIEMYISKNGHSLTINITKQAEILGLDWGDSIIVTLSRPKDAHNRTETAL